jgi:nucleoside-diphosphate-sugar epimerase
MVEIMSASTSKPDSRTMLITGASGFIGGYMARVALTQGYVVKTLSRSTASIPATVTERHRYIGELPGKIPIKAFQDVSVVVHCAAWVKAGSEMARSINVEGTLNLAEMAFQEKVETFIFLSSQSARHDATSDYGLSKYSAEQALLSRFLNTGLKIIILRPGLVTGPGHQGLYRRLCRIVDAWPILPLLGGGKSIVQPIHVEDLCYAIYRCDQIAAQLNGRILNLGCPGGVVLAEFLQALASARRGRKKFTITVPIWPVAAAVLTAERLGLSLPITSVNLKGLTKVERMKTQEDMAFLGVPIRPLEVILREDLRYDSALLREARLISHYLLGIRPSLDLQIRYAVALGRLKIELDRDEQRLWRIIERCPNTLRMIDSGLAFIKPQGGIRRKLYTMLAILETSPHYSDHFLPKACTLVQGVKLVWVGLRAGISTLLGLMLIKVMKVRPN